MASPHDTPAMRQYHRFKKQYPDCVLFFRMGDFFELFYDDARLAAQVLGLTLTQRTEGIPMAGVPYHAVDNYLRRMLQAGYRVALCDQVEDAAQAKGIVRREVTRLVTPGTLTDEALLDEASDNALAAVCFEDDQAAAVAVAELSTGRFLVAHLAADVLRDELARMNPRELLYVETADGRPPRRVAQLAEAIGCALTARPAWQFRPDDAADTLRRQFGVASLAGFGLQDGDPVIGPAGAVVAYLLETQRTEDGRLAHLSPPRRFERSDHLLIDRISLRSLEIETTLRSGQVAGSLLGTLQNCRTAMGKRMLRHWLCYPLLDKDKIQARQDAVQALVNDPDLADALAGRFQAIQDVQRISSRIAVGRPSPRDLVALGQSLGQVQALADLLDGRPAFDPARRQLLQVAAPLDQLGQLLRRACVEAPPAHLRDGGVIREGYDQQLDQYRALQRDSTRWLADYQARLASELGIASLKVGYNRVFGYYIEITHANADRVPDHFTRKQTLKNAERYITPELKEYENKVLGAASKAVAREQDLFADLCRRAADRLEALQRFAQTVAELDVLCGFARRAARFGYCRPRIVDRPVLHIVGGRHPVLDELLADRFVPNDLDLGGTNDATLALITGPNMSGKSTYIRQAALLTLMAHTGSFIPAEQATVGLTDRIFTRIGASDELHAGQSTFMVEMVETANLCHHATERSLVILDEIGRGTSTLDGLSLAWALTEHLAQRRCRTLFATHYHELVQLGEQFDNVINLNVTVREWADQVVFLHRIAPGAASRSYGIHVAEIAGLPRAVIQRARQLMDILEVQTRAPGSALAGSAAPKADPDGQLSLFTEYLEHPALDRLRQIDLDRLSPLDAFDLLRQIKEELDRQP